MIRAGRGTPQRNSVSKSLAPTPMPEPHRASGPDTHWHTPRRPPEWDRALTDCSPSGAVHGRPTDVRVEAAPLATRPLLGR